MDYKLYADESGTSSVDKCYTIGCLLIKASKETYYRDVILKLRDKHNLPTDREMKWSKLKNNHGVINFLIDLIKLIITSDISYVCQVVWKKYYNKWQNNREEAFYTTYTLLLKSCVKILNANIDAKIDSRTDRYTKQNEVIKIIGNYGLKECFCSISEVEKVDSKTEFFVQLSDLITGAINSGHNLYLNPEVVIHNGKRLAISKIAECLSWHSLHYDTFPNPNLNIWHFPQKEFRANPETREIVPNVDVQYVMPEDILPID